MTATDLTIRPFLDNEEFAIYVMRLSGALGPEEAPGPEDLAIAVAVTRDALIVQNALRALEHYCGGGRTVEAPELAEEPAICCPWCGGDVIAVERHCPTGATAPDGTQEYQTQQGYKCRECSRVEEF
jgi:hypothetical protein